MRFFEIVVSGAALISAAFAVTIDTYPSAVVAGQTYQITYSPKDQPATFVLRKGNSADLQTVGTIGTGTGGTFSWTVDKSLPTDGTYALQVIQGTENNYSGQFPLTGGSTAVSSASAAVSSAAASASAAVSSIKASLSSVLASASSAAASASISPSAGTNATISSATLSASRTASRSTSATGTSTGTGIPQSTGAASALDASPLALIFGAVAAFAYLA
ncbi:hypothetical protein EK21DRAFT_84326 [Setomelanomma holmii]|uniref:Yeast cell wall synthesis Kre9/Knh1-like N-terminal domain-containing protein n=1 Tax=Setomelanomma holmii TaxID=210430 RepID=A0A9P4LSV1_9PLEO|nr:hypothetical protein EK21DRAFT_84326 [Setomelanomma holmii]